MFPFWTVLPFLALLLCIALLPILAGHFWHSNLRRGLIALGLSLPVLVFLLFEQKMDLAAESLKEYVEFILPLTALYVIAGGIVVHGHFRPTPLTNTLFLAAGAILANVIGTTGASMLLVRPLLRINRHRKHHGHIVLFYIFVVGNTGGLLTPLGDPPLLLGFLHGIDFFWTLSLWPQWLTANGLILATFFVWDSVRRASPAESPSLSGAIGLEGLVNLLFLIGVLTAVVLHLPWPWSSVGVGAMAVLSLLCTPRRLRHANDFTWEAMIEVAVLFVGIFVTMIPPLQILEHRGKELGISSPWQFFWLTGGLSAFLDNAPTYLTFATVAAGSTRLDGLMTAEPNILAAISCGAVFMGAMTYIGNAPNFMVKAMAENIGYRTASFFGHLGFACLVLLPIFGVVAFWFF